MQIAIDLIQRERVQGCWEYAEGQALDPHPNLAFKKPEGVNFQTV